MTSPVLIAYVPVLHAGYLQLFERHQGKAQTLYLPSQGLSLRLEQRPEIRAIEPVTMAGLIQALNYFERVVLLDDETRWEISEGVTIYSVDDSLSHRLMERYFPRNRVVYDSAFLRWDEANVMSQQPVGYDWASTTEFDRQMMARATQEAGKSGDWWRRVGGVIVRDQEILLTGYNQHVPSQQVPYIDGDPRDSIPAGQQSEMATAIHLEQLLIASAASRGLSLAGSSLYVTVFPCPACAKLVAYAGIEAVYFGGGHASLDGQTILKARGVELIYVPKEAPET